MTDEQAIDLLWEYIGSRPDGMTANGAIGQLAMLTHGIGRIAGHYNDLARAEDGGEGDHVKQEIKRRLHFELIGLGTLVIEAMKDNNFSFDEDKNG